MHVSSGTRTGHTASSAYSRRWRLRQTVLSSRSLGCVEGRSIRCWPSRGNTLEPIESQRPTLTDPCSACSGHREPSQEPPIHGNRRSPEMRNVFIEVLYNYSVMSKVFDTADHRRNFLEADGPTSKLKSSD